MRGKDMTRSFRISARKARSLVLAAAAVAFGSATGGQAAAAASAAVTKVLEFGPGQAR